MKMKKLTALLLATLMVLSLAACGAKGDSKTENSGDTAQTEEAAATHKSLMDRENEILSENTELWEKVFLAADKGMAMIEDGKNYGDFLLDTIESAKDQFSDEEYALLKKSAQEISEIENKLTELEKQHPEILNEGTDANGDVQKFPSFEGKDLDGNEVKSDELFSANAVTVVNFWFTTCSPCVGELADLEALNKKLAEKGGAVVGINSFTLDGDKTAINDAKDILTKKGVSYKNVWFDSKSEAGKFTSGLYSYPTTYVVDKNGNIMTDNQGGPKVGTKFKIEKQNGKWQITDFYEQNFYETMSDKIYYLLPNWDLTKQ